MSGGGKTQTSTSTVQIPPEVLARYNAVNARAESVAGTPFQQYSQNPNAFVAPMTGTQQQAIGQIGQASGMAQPWFNAAGAATAGGMGAANLGQLDVDRYMSPYIRNVAQTTADIMGQDFGQQMSGQLGNAIMSGAGWGDRSGVAAANLARQQQMGLGSTISNILNQGYQGAMGTAQQQQSADLAARQANLARLLQGGQAFGQLGAGAQGSALAGAQALLGAGTQEQQTNQAGLSALYNQFLQERAYPFQVAQFLGNLAMGTGALSGSTTQTTSPAGFFSGFKDGGKVIEGSYRRGGLVPESMGGHVGAEHMGEGYADGGAPQDYSTFVMQQLFGGMDPSAGAYGLNKMGLGAASYIPRGDLPVGQLMVANPVASPKQTSISDIADVASSVADTADRGRKLWEEMNKKPEAYGGAAYARGGLAAGGTPYDPQNTGYVPDNSPGKAPELLQPKAPEQDQESGLGKVADIAKIAMMFMGMNRGGSAYADGGHVVERGDTLTDIARKYGTTLENILSANPQFQKNPDLIRIGERVNIPALAQAAGTPFPPAPSTFPARPGVAGALPVAAAPIAGGARPEGLAAGMPAAKERDFNFPSFDREHFQGSYMSDPRQKDLMNVLRLEAVRRAGGLATGGVASRDGYLDGGFASDAALAELARKKREQEILGELGSSDWSGGLGGPKPAEPYGINVPTADTRALGSATSRAVVPEAAVRQPATLREILPLVDAGNTAFGPATSDMSPLETMARPTLDVVANAFPAVAGLAGQGYDFLTKKPSEYEAAYNPAPIPTARIHPELANRPAAPATTGTVRPGLGTTLSAGAGMPVGGAKPVDVNAPLDLTTGKPAVERPAAMNAPRNVRNNNPGNLVASNWTQQQPGFIGTDGPFAVFDTPENGRRAQAQLLTNYINSGDDTLTKIINRWAPPDAAGNSPESTRNYINHIAAQTGLDPNQQLTAADVSKILDAQAGFEGGTTGGVRTGTSGLGGGNVATVRAEGAAPAGGLSAGTTGPNILDQAVAKAGGMENIVLPFLSGLGKMAGSQSRFLGTALLEGLGGGAEAYMNRQKQLADIAQTQAMTRGMDIQNVGRSIIDIGGVNYVVTANGGVQQFNDWLKNPSAPVAGGDAVNAMVRNVGQQLASQTGSANTGDAQSVLLTIQTTPREVEGGAGMPVARTPAAAPGNVAWDDRAATAVDRADSLMSAPTARAMIENSAALLNDVTAGGVISGNNRLNIAEQAMAVSTLMGASPLESFGAGGQGRASILKALNLMSDTLGLGPVSDTATENDIMQKLSFAQANNMVNASNQDSFNALAAAANMMPNIDQDPKAAATIMSTLMVDNQRAIDRAEFYNAFADQTTSKILQPAGSEFNRLYDTVYKQEVNYLKDLLTNPAAAPYIKGAMEAGSPEEAQRILSNAFGGNPIPPKLYRYFVSGGVI